MMAAMSDLTSEARRLYDEALQRPGGQQAFTRDPGKGGGGPRERALYDPPRLQDRGPPQRPLFGSLQEMTPRP